jgi:hypothetical protein
MGPMGLMGMSRRVPEGVSFSSSSSNPAARSDGVLEYSALTELHPASAGLEMLSGLLRSHSLKNHLELG